MSPGGFRRFLEKGTVFYDCCNRAVSFSASSLATLATGTYPAQHGIVADRWYDRALKAPVRASEEELQATTLAAQIAADNRYRVYVAGMDETSTALFAGTPEARLFWMDAAGQFATRGETPDWLTAWNSQHSADAAREAKWQAVGAKSDAPPLRTLYYSAARPREFANLYKASPFGVGAQFDFLAEMMARYSIGQTSSLDIVVLVQSSTALLGYETGGRSLLMQQMVLHIDRRLEALFAQLAKTPGEGQYNVVVTGAHGAPLEPSSDMRDHLAVNGELLAQAVERALISGPGGHVEKYLYPYFYLNTTGFRDVEPIRNGAAQAVLRNPGVSGYYTATGACSTRDEWERRFRNSFHPRRSGDLMVSYQPECVEDFGQGRGISYGSLYNYDVKVPLYFYGPSFRVGAIEAPVELVDVAPTLARAVGVAAPSSSTGRVLGEALVE